MPIPVNRKARKYARLAREEGLYADFIRVLQQYLILCAKDPTTAWSIKELDDKLKNVIEKNPNFQMKRAADKTTVDRILVRAFNVIEDAMKSR